MSMKRWILFLSLTIMSILCAGMAGYRLVVPKALDPVWGNAAVALCLSLAATLSLLSKERILNFITWAGLIMADILVAMTVVAETKYRSDHVMLLMATVMIPVLVMCLVVNQRQHLATKVSHAVRHGNIRYVAYALYAVALIMWVYKVPYPWPPVVMTIGGLLIAVAWIKNIRADRQRNRTI